MKETYKIKRTFKKDDRAPIDYGRKPEDICFKNKEQAADACIWYIAEDIGVTTGEYDPELWGGLSWEDHAKSIKDCLVNGVSDYEYANLKWEIVKEVEFEVGDRVYWNDPDDGICSGVYKVDKINGETITISNESGSEAEVPFEEIERIK